MECDRSILSFFLLTLAGEGKLSFGLCSLCKSKEFKFCGYDVFDLIKLLFLFEEDFLPDLSPANRCLYSAGTSSLANYIIALLSFDCNVSEIDLSASSGSTPLWS